MKKILGKLAPNAAMAQRDLEKRALEWRLSRCNDKAIWQKESDIAAVTHAAELLKSDPEDGRLELHTLAENGSVWSMLLLGWCYQIGAAGNADYEKATDWYGRSSGADCQQAQLRLAKLYLHHKDVDRCADMISDRPWSPVMYYVALAKLMQPRTTARLNEARDLLERSAVGGDVEAQGWLAGLYLRGMFGFKLCGHGLRASRIYLKNADAFNKDQALVPWEKESSRQRRVAEGGASNLNRS